MTVAATPKWTIIKGTSEKPRKIFRMEINLEEKTKVAKFGAFLKYDTFNNENDALKVLSEIFKNEKTEEKQKKKYAVVPESKILGKGYKVTGKDTIVPVAIFKAVFLREDGTHFKNKEEAEDKAAIWIDTAKKKLEDKIEKLKKTIAVYTLDLEKHEKELSAMTT